MFERIDQEVDEHPDLHRVLPIGQEDCVDSMIERIHGDFVIRKDANEGAALQVGCDGPFGHLADAQARPQVLPDDGAIVRFEIALG